MCLVDQEADSQEDQTDHELNDQLLPDELKPAVKTDIDHSQGHQDQANWGDQADVALPPVVGIDYAGPVDADDIGQRRHDRHGQDGQTRGRLDEEAEDDVDQEEDPDESQLVHASDLLAEEVHDRVAGVAFIHHDGDRPGQADRQGNP